MVENEEGKNEKEKYSLKDFKIIEEIGYGAYAKVFKAELISTETIYALKAIDKKLILKEGKLHHVYIELNLCKEFDSPYIGKIHDMFEENGKLILVMDYYENGDLFDFIKLNSK